ncbi:MAG: formate--phosphoribosylaminoimidazolecarboxamide ligase [Nitrososphaerota archaeon]|nr:formate--phosphoribosylaminoimidazolecarboxamide ligase [Aigarchaeota archaeon]MDW8076666.1 formate--phosphoribosylaminoimidazolecarboxamide ligase [Nitrososphaerota archaeon]
MNVSIATYGSHSALQILKGAKDEGLRAILLCPKNRRKLYGRFRLADELLLVNGVEDLLKEEIQKDLINKGSVLVPHGTIISDVDINSFVKDFRVPIFGNRELLVWESDRELKERLLREAGIKVPRAFSSPDEVDCPVIVKLPGAEGGRGYFLASGREDLMRKLTELGVRASRELYIQEYVLGVTVYPHFFYSPLKGEVELLGIDRRYETNVDALGRIPASNQLSLDLQPTYEVVGNIPLVLRESMLERFFDIAERFVEATKRLVPPGMIGPFCIEAACRAPDDILVFEFSARIVAGTNLFINGSPYSYLLYGEGMSMGRRIAKEIKLACETFELDKLVT